VRNKARLVAQGFSQVECLDFGETFAPITRLVAVRILLAFAAFKACLVAQGFSQVEGLDFRETFAHVTRLRVIRILLAFATSKGFKLYQMDVKALS
jgi:hypothetical protein